MFSRIFAILHARNLEFIRDRSSLSWNIIFPVLLVGTMAVIFSGKPKPVFEVAVIPPPEQQNLAEIRHPFLAIPHIHFFIVNNQTNTMKKLSQHQLDMLLDFSLTPPGFWVNPSSDKGDILTRLADGAGGEKLQAHTIEGEAIRYVDWLAPGVLGMNMMFSCLFGVGFVIVRYRKNGYLKRLKATPITAFEFLIAQVISRLLLIMTITTVVFIGINHFLHLHMNGSYLNLFILTTLGAFSMISMALLIAARVNSEELAGGLLNLISWPMMLVSGVWFPMSNAPEFMQKTAEFLPLTHLLNGARRIMFDGAGLPEIFYHIAVLATMSFAFLILGAVFFKWSPD